MGRYKSAGNIHYARTVIGGVSMPLNYTGQSKIIRRICEIVNGLYAARPRLFIDAGGYISVEYEEAGNE